MDSQSRRSRAARLLVMGLAAMLALGGCAVAEVETPDPAEIPSASLQAMGAEPTGPIVELGSAVALGWGWRYSIYPSRDGWCTQLELAEVASTSCGPLLPEGDEVFGSIGSGEMAGIQTIEGAVSADTATVWLIGEENVRAPAVLMSLEPAGLEHRAFVGFAPADIVLTHLQAIAANGAVLDTIDLR